MTKEIVDVEKVIREYLSGVIHMSLGTSVDGKPWVCEVHFSFDDELNIYFRSTKLRRHSIEIAKNPNVAGNIVEQHGMTDKPRGVYFEGRAEILEPITETDLAYMTVSKRYDLGPDILLSESAPSFYKITVSDFYLFDARDSSPSKKYHLQWK